MTVKSSLLEMLEKNKGEILQVRVLPVNLAVQELQCGRQ